jgi:hypothetical protein
MNEERNKNQNTQQPSFPEVYNNWAKATVELVTHPDVSPGLREWLQNLIKQIRAKLQTEKTISVGSGRPSH